MKLSIIVPCYNEQEALPFFYDEFRKALSHSVFDYELIFVNDGSTDETLSCIKELAKRDENVKYLSFSRNFGKEAAMYAGFCNADGEYVGVMDADMQDPPALIPEMLEILCSGEYDCVATRRVSRKGEPPIRSFFARIFYRIINKISDANVVDGARDFRIMRREMADAVVAMAENNRFSKGIFGWVGFRTKWIPFENTERIAGKTKWSFWGLLSYALDGIINFSEMPLNIASWFGLVMTAVSFFFLMVIVIRKLCFGDPVAGWASTISIMLFIGGIQLFCMGVMGQYIAKIYGESKKRPHYIISETNKSNAERIR
ncbi:MAG: glycosyltransferase family 2 protein [Eubacteriales bacterium]|nr:glycosyltransferase family 2 protein [Eubacteriales bacterium]